MGIEVRRQHSERIENEQRSLKIRRIRKWATEEEETKNLLCWIELKSYWLAKIEECRKQSSW